MRIPYLPAYIIEKLKELRRRQKPGHAEERPVLRAPPPQPPLPPPPRGDDHKEEQARGPIIIDMATYGVIDKEI